MNDYKTQVTEFFNRRTAYDQEGTSHPREAKNLLESVPVQKGQKILDLATGTGLVAIPAAQKVGNEGSVVGVDMSPGMLHQARQKIEAARLKNIKLIEADIDFINFEDESFDLIFCCSAITYLTDIPTILQKCYRWLKQRGFIAFTCPAETAYMASVQSKVCARLFDISLPHINEPLWTKQKCYHLLQQAGFRDIEIQIERRGEYLNPSDRIMSWDGGGFYPRGNPLSDLSPQQLAQLQAEYKKEIEQLVTDQGIWYDRTTFFVQACK